MGFIPWGAIGSAIGGAFSGGNASKTIPAIGGLVGGMFGGKAAAGMGEEAKKAQSNLLDLSDVNKQMAVETGGMAKNFMGGAADSLGQAKGYFSGLLSGDRTATAAALAPDINRINSQNTAATRAAYDLNPRGGGASGNLFDLPMRNASASQGLFNEMRPKAAASLMDIGKTEGAIGSSLFGSSGNFGNAAINASGNILDAGVRQKLLESQMGGQIGGGIKNILDVLPWGKWTGGKGVNWGNTQATDILL